MKTYQNYDIPEHFKSDDCFQPYSLPIKENKVRLTTKNTYKKQTMENVMSLFSKYMTRIYKKEKKEKILLSELNRLELISIESKEIHNNDIIKVKTDMHNLQLHKIETIKQDIVVALDKNEKRYMLNMKTTFLNFPDNDENDFMTHLVDMLLLSNF